MKFDIRCGLKSSLFSSKLIDSITVLAQTDSLYKSSHCNSVFIAMILNFGLRDSSEILSYFVPQPRVFLLFCNNREKMRCRGKLSKIHESRKVEGR